MDNLLAGLTIYTDGEIALTTNERVEIGDNVRYKDDDSGEWLIGTYLNLWFYASNGRETSPFVNDDRHMAYIATSTGGTTYADIRTIAKLAIIPSVRL